MVHHLFVKVEGQVLEKASLTSFSRAGVMVYALGGLGRGEGTDGDG